MKRPRLLPIKNAVTRGRGFFLDKWNARRRPAVPAHGILLDPQNAPAYRAAPERSRTIALTALSAVAAGLVIGILAARAWLIPTPVPVVTFDRAQEDDYILMVAEAYALDRSIPLAQHRLARLNDPRTNERIIELAERYAPYGDFVAQRLALLAVAAGGKQPQLVALAVTAVAAPPRTDEQPVAPTAAPTPTPLPPTRVAYVPPPPTATLEPVYIVVTGEPTRTPTPRPKTWTPTPIVETEEERPATVAPMPLKLAALKLPVNLPEYVKMPSFEMRLAARPKVCTPPDQMPPEVTTTIMLCAGQVYAPFVVKGNNLTIYGDPDKTALVKGEPRRYAITVIGTNVSIVGVHVEGATHPADLDRWLCLYPSCPFEPPEVGGALGYGGGILLKNTANAVVYDSQFNGGTVGVVSDRGYSNKLVNNTFSDLNGWGALLMRTRSDYVVGNKFARINRGCIGLDNVYHPTGCESAGLAITHSTGTVVVDNHCRVTSNCYYANGDGGYGSKDLKFYNNHCAAARNNCFEVTFSTGGEFDYNTATYDAEAGESCDYPFWIGGSTVYFGEHNSWNCVHDYETALNDSRNGANQPTDLHAIAALPPPAPTFTHTPTLLPQVVHAPTATPVPAKGQPAKPQPANPQ